MSEFGKDFGLVHEAVVTGRKVGADAKFWAALAHGEEVFQKVVALVFQLIAPVFRLVAGFDRDMAKEEWELVSDTEAKEGEFTPELVEFLKEGESYVNGEEMVKRMGAEDCGGQRMAEAMLREEEKIPVEWRQYVLVFIRTVWQDGNRNQNVAYLNWNGTRWYRDFNWLDDGFDRDYRVVRLRNSLHSPLSCGVFLDTNTIMSRIEYH